MTTSRLLSTGVDVQTCKNIVLFRVINSMTEFKQIIGRGTRIRADYGKLFFSIIDYTGSATRMFKDEAFDGEPVLLTQEEIDAHGKTKKGTEKIIKDKDESEFEAADEANEEYICGLPGDNLIDGNHRMEKARRMGLASLMAYKMNVEQHMKFLTDKNAYVAYIEYWNSKLAESPGG